MGSYKKAEDTFVDGYKKIEDAFVDTFLEKVTEGNNVPENPVEKEKQHRHKEAGEN